MWTKLHLFVVSVFVVICGQFLKFEMQVMLKSKDVSQLMHFVVM